MKIFYHCYAGAHSSVVASALHCGKLPLQRVPTRAEILAIPYFDQTTPDMIGTPFLMGHDEFDHEIYFIGMRHGGDVVKNAILSFCHIYQLSQDQVRFFDALPVINSSTKIGGGLSRRLGCVCFGRSLSVWGIQRCYQGFVDLVHSVKQELVGAHTKKT